MEEKFLITKINGTPDFGPRHQFLRFEIPSLEISDAVTKILPKFGFKIPERETSDAHLYGHGIFFLFSTFTFYPAILQMNNKIRGVWPNI